MGATAFQRLRREKAQAEMQAKKAKNEDVKKVQEVKKSESVKSSKTTKSKQTKKTVEKPRTQNKKNAVNDLDLDDLELPDFE